MLPFEPVHVNQKIISSLMNKSRSQFTLSGNLTQTQVKYMLKITQKIYDFPISLDFREPVNLKDYLEKIKKPMDLGTVLEKIKKGAYPNVEKWREDMNLIWKNALSYNNQTSLLWFIASELQIVFKQMSEEIPKNDLEEWRYKVKRAHQKLIKVAEAKPEVEKKPNMQPGAPRSGTRTRLLLRAPSQTIG